MPGPISGSSSNIPLQKSHGNFSIAKADNHQQLTFAKADVAKASGNKVLDLSGVKNGALQNKEAFTQALKSLDGNSGQDFIKVKLSAGANRGNDVYISLSALEKIPSGVEGKTMRDQLIDSLMSRVESFDKNPHSFLKELTMELPHFDTQGGKEVTQNAGGFQYTYGAETQRTVTKNFSVDAKDLSAITSLNDPMVTSLIEQVTSKVGDGGKLATTHPDGLLTPTKGFDLAKPQGQEQIRKMLDGYLAGGKFNQELYNQVDAKGKPTEAAVAYQKQVQDGLKSLIATGAKDVGISNVDAFTKKFTDTMFSDKKIGTEDVKTIQTAFAAMAKGNEAFQRILDMPNPETGEKPKNNGIDGIPATRFAVVTSTLFAALEKKVTESRGTPPPPIVETYQPMVTDLGSQVLKTQLGVTSFGISGVK